MKRESSTVHGGVGIHNSAELQTRKRYWLRAKFIIFRIFHLIWCCSSSCSFHLAWLFSFSAGFSINYDNNISTQQQKIFETNHRDFFDTVVFFVCVCCHACHVLLAFCALLFLHWQFQTNSRNCFNPISKKRRVDSSLHSDFPTLPGSPRSSFMSGMHHQREAMHGEIKAVENHKSHSLCNNWWMERLAGWWESCEDIKESSVMRPRVKLQWVQACRRTCDDIIILE